MCAWRLSDQGGVRPGDRRSGDTGPGRSRSVRESRVASTADENCVDCLVRPFAETDLEQLDLLLDGLRDARAPREPLGLDDLAPLRDAADGRITPEASGAGASGPGATGAGTMLVAELRGTIIGAARYVPIAGSRRATVVLAVADLGQRRELAARLVSQLATAAHESGIEHFVADLSSASAGLLAVFVRAGFSTEISVGDGTMRTTFSVDPKDRDAGKSQVRAVPVWESVPGGRPRGQEAEDLRASSDRSPRHPS